jgi:hypothetical protein
MQLNLYRPTEPMTARSKMFCQIVLIKPKPCQREQKMHSTCVDLAPLMKAKAHNASQPVLTIPIQCQRGHRMHLYLC